LDEAAFPADATYISGNFGGFLQYAMEQSGCDKKAKERFRHAAGGYKFEGDYEAFQRELEAWSMHETVPTTGFTNRFIGRYGRLGIAISHQS
jgi:hypothetical protein